MIDVHAGDEILHAQLSSLHLKPYPYFIDPAKRIRLGWGVEIGGLNVGMRYQNQSVLIGYIARTSSSVPANLFSFLRFVKSLSSIPEVRDIRGYVFPLSASTCSSAARLAGIYQLAGATVQRDSEGENIFVFSNRETN